MPDVDTQKSDICLVVMDFKDPVSVGPHSPILVGLCRAIWAQLFEEENGTHGAKL